ncbi:MAG TPA: tryptophan-rich sensory protein [Candidatus Enterousia intestinigallinarum]|uniref:Tryptophan-rich sensory protein n=1 Tax=Candidatus Enterousia intestinigallinarum TaxID=2840790 RepID=A0A9D1FG41_9PROT|nr:tryptophan-rich sensory protein [Candidatus Enterousia intestinigallinarum]
MKKFWLFVLAVVISFLPGLIGLIFSPSGASDLWYNALNKPFLTPDGWVFAVVWPILYFLLGVALYLIIVDKTRYSKAKSYGLFAVHMALNALWTYFFFGLNLIGGGLIVLVLLIAFTIWMMRAFSQISRAAYYLVWPYLIWLLFALYLNGSVLFLN